MGICGGTLSEHGTSVPIGSTVISGLKSRAPTTTNINLLVSFEFLEVPNLAVRFLGGGASRFINEKHPRRASSPRVYEIKFALRSKLLAATACSQTTESEQAQCSRGRLGDDVSHRTSGNGSVAGLSITCGTLHLHREINGFAGIQ